eukprot:jgi/Mesen1/8800/ME000528S08187
MCVMDMELMFAASALLQWEGKGYAYVATVAPNRSCELDLWGGGDRDGGYSEKAPRGNTVLVHPRERELYDVLGEVSGSRIVQFDARSPGGDLHEGVPRLRDGQVA